MEEISIGGEIVGIVRCRLLGVVCVEGGDCIIVIGAVIIGGRGCGGK